MKPYYQDEYVTLYCGDCREILPSLGGQFDAIVSDPPYGLAGEFDAVARPGRYGRAGGRVANDGDVQCAEWLEEFIAARALPAILFGMWQRVPANPRRQLIWDKEQIGLSGTDLPWINSHEVAWVFGKGWLGSKRGTVYRTGRERDAQHPTQKPVELMQFILSCAPQEWTICDPFCGSGTTLVAAKALGRRAIGIEIDERHCRTAAQRLSQNVLDFGGAA